MGAANLRGWQLPHLLARVIDPATHPKSAIYQSVCIYRYVCIYIYMKSRTGGGLAVLQEVLDGGEVPECQLLVFPPPPT